MIERQSRRRISPNPEAQRWEIARAGAYFVCPFLGYNFIWNMRIFSGSAPFRFLVFWF